VAVVRLVRGPETGRGLTSWCRLIAPPKHDDAGLMRSALLLFAKNLRFTVLIPGTVAVYIPLSIGFARPVAPGSSEMVLRVLSLVPLAVGASVYLWCLWDFATFGRGTPAPIDAPKRLVVRGLYRYVRNPMYVGVLLAILGWALRFSSLWLLLYAAGIGLMFHGFVVAYEEPALRRLFGGDYAAYCSRVGRWVPRLRPGRGA